MANVVELQKVNKIYRNGVAHQVLFNIDLSFEKGSFNAIVGESGSGKTTLMNIMGILDKPTSGDIYIDSDKINGFKKDKLAEIRNQSIGFIFQFHYLLPEFTALENVLMPYLIDKKKPAREITARANELFELMGITEVKKSLATRMSGGQQQRTAIARALINNPKIILADEPTGNLDSENTATIYRIFREINREYGTTFIIVTHDRRIAEQTDRIIELKDGRVSLDIKK